MEKICSADEPRASLKKDFIICLLIILVSCLVYYQLGSHPFMSFDDSDYVYDNPHVKTGITLENVRWAFGFPDNQYWAPLSYISHMLDVELFGMNPGMHHLVNLSLHIMNSLLLFMVLRLMTGARWRSAFVAGLFALHPVNVDTVAWVAERKNILSTTFWLLSMISYWFYVQKPFLRRYCIILAAFCLGLLSKPMLVTLPFVFLLLDYWPLRRIRFIWNEKAKGKKAKGGNLEMEGAAVSRLIIEKLPMLALSLAAIVISSQSIHQHGDIISTGRVPMGLRVENAIVSYVLYLWKMVCPMNLTFYYPYPESIPGWQVVGAAIVLLLATAFILKHFFRAPYAFVGWLWFLGTLVPVSGLVQGGLWPAIAERWAYVPFIGLFITISWAVPDIVDRLGFRKRVLPFPAAAVLAVLAVLTWNQAGYWKDELAFYSRGVKINPNNFVAHGNLGVAYARLNRRQEAIPHFLTVVRHEPYDYTAWENLGEAYKKDKKTDQAIDCYLQALKYDPKPASVHYSLGELYADQGNLDKAAGEFTEVIRLKSRDAGAYYNLGVISAKKGNRAEAVRLLSSALKIKPHDADAHCALGVILVNENRIPEAVAHFKDVLQWDPGNREARDYLNAVLNSKAGKGTALPVIEQGSRNGDPKALYKEAVLFSSKGEYAKALEALSKLREIQPDNPDVYYNIACIYAKQNRPEESVNWLKTSLEKGFKDWKLIAGDHDLDNIRQTEGYRRLMMQKKP